MRGEVFKEYFELLNESEDEFYKEDGSEYTESDLPNHIISKNLVRLQEHYTLLLEYVDTLENRLMDLKDRDEILERRLNWYVKKESERLFKR